MKTENPLTDFFTGKGDTIYKMRLIDEYGSKSDINYRYDDLEMIIDSAQRRLKNYYKNCSMEIYNAETGEAVKIVK